MRSLFACLSLSLVAMASAWIDTGHMVIAKIAEGRLAPNTAKRVQALSQIDVDDKTRGFVQCSCWADDFKSNEDRHWHYTNIHFRMDGKPTSNKPLDENVLWAIQKFTKDLGNARLPQRDRAKALRYLVHFVGDAHNPLHTMARDSDRFPNGDRGGNSFKITPIDDWGASRPLDNLHVVWDFGLGEFPAIDRPLTRNGELSIERISNSITRQHPYRSLPNAKIQNPEAWIQEGFALRSFVYSARENQRLSESYIREGRAISRRVAALAGYRLADLLNRVLK